MTGDAPDIDYGALLKRSLATIEELEAKLERDGGNRRESLAVVGIGCRFPGGADTPDAFWRLLAEGVDAVAEIPRDRWDVEATYDPEPGAPGKSYARWGAFIDCVDRFDAQFFGISPREAQTMDPQQRILLEVAWEALENAGQAPGALAGSRTGVFFGLATSDYAHLHTQFGSPERVDGFTATGFAHSVAAGRVSYTLGLQGPSIAVDTACSSSLVATHLACQSLRLGECDLALAGGINLILSAEGNLLLAQARMLAGDGRCKAFAADADGFVRGEGCGLVVLKRLSDALADGETVLAVIEGSAVNQDGRSSGLSAPNGAAQEQVIRAALADAGLEAGAIDYVEAHGTGTSLGDPIEIRAIDATYGQGRGTSSPLLVGSVKTNLGHLEAAAGIAGLIKAILSLRHDAVPPHLHLDAPNPHLPWDDLPLTIPRERLAWPRSADRPRLAGVSSFGFSGTNVHMIVGDAPAAARATPEARPPDIVVLSAKTDVALAASASRFGSHLAGMGEGEFPDVCFTAATGRTHFGERLAVVASSATEARELLLGWSAGDEHAAVKRGTAPSVRAPDVAFLCTGQGSQYVDMGRRLYEVEPAFREALDACATLFDAHLPCPLLDVLFAPAGDRPERALDETQYAQPALFALEYALAAQWRSWGIVPAALLGHSIGEYVAACLAGVLSLEDATRLVAERGRLMQLLPPGGAMIAIAAGEDEVRSVMGAFRTVDLAAVNGPSGVVVSGDSRSVEALARRFAGAGIETSRLAVSHAFHSPLVDPVLEEFESVCRSIELRAPELPLVSNVTGRLVEPGEVVDPSYWVRHMRATVRFQDGMHSLGTSGCALFVELGPAPVLSAMAARFTGDDAVFVSSLRRGEDDATTMRRGLAALHAAGVDVDWTAFHGSGRRLVTVPTYPFQRQRHWLELGSDRGAAAGSPLDHPLLGRRLAVALPLYEPSLSDSALAYLHDHRVHGQEILPAPAFLEMARAAAADALGRGSGPLADILIREPLHLDRERAPSVQIALAPGEDGDTRFQVFSCPSDGAAWVLHAEGRILAAHEHQPERDSPGSPADLVSVPPAAHYEVLEGIGVSLGPSFRTLAEVHRRDHLAVGRIALPDGIAPAAGEGAHPALLDGCVQLLGAAVPGATEERAHDAHVYVPVAVRRYELFDALGSEVWCRAELEAPGAEDTMVGNLTLTDRDGRLVGRLDGVVLRRVERAALEHLTARAGASSDDWLHEVAWRTIQPDGAGGGEWAAGRWLLLADEQGVAGALRSLLKAHGATCSLIHEDEIRRLGKAVAEEPLAGVVHLWSLEPDGSGADVANRVDALCAGVLELVHGLADSGADGAGPPRLLLVTRGAQAATPGEEVPSLPGAALWGLGAVVAREHPELGCTLVDLDPAAGAEESAAALLDTLALAGGERIAVRAGQLRVARLVRRAPLARIEPAALRADGSYLVTGGLGGLGLAVASQLAERGAGSLVLMGRSEPSEAARARLAELEAAGALVKVVSGDVADPADVARAVEVAGALAPLRGIVHAAGVLDDGLLRAQTPDRMARVLAPKVRGAMNLHEATLGFDLDFVVFFASVAGVLGSAGQGGYAAANAFLDALAADRRARGLPALSVDWSRWTDVGMAASLDEASARRWEQAGIGGIAPEQGVRILAQLLGEPRSPASIVVLPLDLERFLAQASTGPGSGFVSALRGERGGQTPARPAIDTELLARFGEAVASERRRLMAVHVAAQVASVLALRDAAEVYPDTAFTDLGMDSLTAAELTRRLQASLGRSLPPTLAFERPTVTLMAEHLTAELEESGIDDAAHRGTSTAAHEAPDGEAATKPERTAPMSFAQQRLWFVDRLQPGLATYNIPLGINLEGTLDVRALERSLEHIVKRHEVLRTRLVLHEGEPVQVVCPDVAFTLPVVHHPGEERELRLAIDQEACAPFDLSEPLKLRARLFEVTPLDHVLVVTLHHSAADGGSILMLRDELEALYSAFSSGRPDPLPPLPLQYGDYAARQRAEFESEARSHDIAYWVRQLDGLEALELPVDRPRPPLESHRGASFEYAMPAEIGRALKGFGKAHGATLFMCVLAAFQAVLARASGQTDIAVGSPVSDRHADELQGSIGLFVNTLVFRGDLSGSPSLRELLVRTRRVALEAIEHQGVPFDQLVDVLRPERDPSRGPLFQVMLAFQGVADWKIELPGLTATPRKATTATSMFDLSLYVYENEGRLECKFEYASDLFDESTIERLARNLEQLVAQGVARPDTPISQLSMCTEDDRRLLADWNDTNDDDIPLDASVHELFEATAARAPNEVALVTSERDMTYGELSRCSDRLAARLAAAGVCCGSVVGVCMERSAELVVSLLGVLKAGAAYLPLDPALPRRRPELIVSDAAPAVIVTRRRDVAAAERVAYPLVVVDDENGADAEPIAFPPVGGGDLCYAIYTSGSSGEPKGVLVPHRAVVNRCLWQARRYPFDRRAVGCIKTSIGFVDSISEILTPLLAGAPSLVVSDADASDLRRFVQVLGDAGVTRIALVPSLLQALLDTELALAEAVPALRLWFTSGEALPSELAERFLTAMPEATLVNLYGCSEAAGDSTYHELAAGQVPARIPIGRPIANTRVYVVDPELALVSPGARGEIAIGGRGIGTGYIGRDHLTAKRFASDPFSDEPGATLYRTGDQGRHLPDGSIEYLGRLDDQVKVRGVRVELGEVEAALSAHPDVAAAAVALQEDAHGEPSLVAYVVHAGGQAPSAVELRTFLRESLTEQMLPSVFSPVATFPLTASGKVDRRALPAPPPPGQGAPDASRRPVTPLEELVERTFAEVLGVAHVGFADDFFALGGHSLLAMQMISRLEAALDVDVSLQGFFQHPTAEGLCALLHPNGQAASELEARAAVVMSVVDLSDEQVQSMLAERGLAT